MTTEIPVLLAAVSLFSALQIGYLARRVGLARMTHKVIPPTVTGPPEFERTFRAHQNNVELYPVFLVVLWTSGLLFSEVLAVLGGVVYMVARHMYFNGYIMSTKKRLPGFYLTLGALFCLSVLSTIGILHGILLEYFYKIVSMMVTH
ncbi:microsomal glutathione S-transferase 2 isoform X1 [Salmo trutta]|uniref:Microsomal glutathione S-transferase 2 n=1 Tax=Salmo trutta TaxID=8032 RepID=A0A674AQC6_SALTR|nr:microsomal glutathione S-transferase 2 isoform X1 [Salmo trutta]